MVGYPVRLSGPWRLWHAAGLTMLWPIEAPTLTSHSFPEHWTALLAKAIQPSRTVWTYWQLGADLFGQPDPGRRAVVLHLFRVLGWPKGSITLWPVCELQEELLVPRPQLFWRGITALSPSVLVFFGSKSLQAALSQLAVPSDSCFLNLPRLELPELGTQLLDDSVVLKACIYKLRTLEPSILIESSDPFV